MTGLRVGNHGSLKVLKCAECSVPLASVGGLEYLLKVDFDLRGKEGAHVGRRVVREVVRNASS